MHLETILYVGERDVNEGEKEGGRKRERERGREGE